MTVSDLRKALKGVSGKIPVYLADHDHSEYETNGSANRVEVMNQKDMSENQKIMLDDCFKIKGNYLVIRVG